MPRPRWRHCSTTRYLLGDAARRPSLLKEQEPFAWIECGQLFGVKSTVGRVSEQLAGKHWMFADDHRARLIQMCNDCRVRAQYHGDNTPFQLGERPRVRTTEDYLEGRINPNFSHYRGASRGHFADRAGKARRSMWHIGQAAQGPACSRPEDKLDAACRQSVLALAHRAGPPGAMTPAIV